VIALNESVVADTIQFLSDRFTYLTGWATKYSEWCVLAGIRQTGTPHQRGSLLVGMTGCDRKSSFSDRKSIQDACPLGNVELPIAGNQHPVIVCNPKTGDY
jgi:hypothetical protein